MTIPERARAPYGTPHVSLLGASSIGWPNDGPALTIESSAGKRPTLPMTNRDGVSFHSDYIPPPPTSPQVIPEGAGPCQGLGDLIFGLSPGAAHMSNWASGSRLGRSPTG